MTTPEQSKNVVQQANQRRTEMAEEALQLISLLDNIHGRIVTLDEDPGHVRHQVLVKLTEAEMWLSKLELSLRSRATG